MDRFFQGGHGPLTGTVVLKVATPANWLPWPSCRTVRHPGKTSSSFESIVGRFSSTASCSSRSGPDDDVRANASDTSGVEEAASELVPGCDIFWLLR